MDIGSRCLAQYSDGKWYECTIISAKPSGTTGARSLKVEFLGYGDRHDVSETDIKPLPDRKSVSRVSGPIAMSRNPAMPAAQLGWTARWLGRTVALVLVIVALSQLLRSTDRLKTYRPDSAKFVSPSSIEPPLPSDDQHLGKLSNGARFAKPRTKARLEALSPAQTHPPATRKKSPPTLGKSSRMTSEQGTIELTKAPQQCAPDCEVHGSCNRDLGRSKNSSLKMRPSFCL